MKIRAHLLAGDLLRLTIDLALDILVVRSYTICDAHHAAKLANLVQCYWNRSERLGKAQLFVKTVFQKKKAASFSTGAHQSRKLATAAYDCDSQIC